MGNDDERNRAKQASGPSLPIHGPQPAKPFNAGMVPGRDAPGSRQQSIDLDSVSVWLQEEEAENGTHSNETIGIISVGD